MLARRWLRLKNGICGKSIKASRAIYSEGARIKNGQVMRFRDTAARILMETGWRPGGVASAMQAASILREHAKGLAALVEISKKTSDSVGK